MSENETKEYKKSPAALKEGLISISAILNKYHCGGLWFGLHNDGSPAKFDIGEKTLRDISDAIAAHIEPKIYPDISLVDHDDHPCIRILFSGTEIPYFAYGRAYMRVGDTDRQLTMLELKSLILVNSKNLMQWDGLLSNVSLSELDEDKIKQFTLQANLTWSSTHNVLSNLDLLKDGMPINASLLFFAKKPILKLRCAIFAGTQNITLLDQADYEGTILELINLGKLYIEKNTFKSMSLDGFVRIDVPELPEIAVREALINAFCHRDYNDPDEVRIAVFQNRVEIRNPGKLQDGLTIGKLRKGGISSRRNPIVAELLKRNQMIEAWGRGIPLILEHAPNTQFQQIAHLFVVTFLRPSTDQNFAEEIAKGSGVRHDLPNTNRNHVNGHTAGASTTDSSISLPVTLSDNEKKLLKNIRKNKNITLKDLSNKIGMSKSRTSYYIKMLKSYGILRRVGSYNGYWEIVNDALSETKSSPQ